MTINSPTHVVPAHEVDLVLYVKVDNADDAVGAHQAVDRVDDGVELGYHAQGIAHRDKLSTSSIRILVQVANGLTLRDHFFALVCSWFMFVETKCARILTDDLDIFPTEAGEPFLGHFTQGG